MAPSLAVTGETERRIIATDLDVFELQTWESELEKMLPALIREPGDCRKETRT